MLVNKQMFLDQVAKWVKTNPTHQLTKVEVLDGTVQILSERVTNRKGANFDAFAKILLSKHPEIGRAGLLFAEKALLTYESSPEVIKWWSQVKRQDLIDSREERPQIYCQLVAMLIEEGTRPTIDEFVYHRIEHKNGL